MDVEAQLQSLKDKYKTVEVEKPIPVEFDLRNLAAFDQNPIDPKALAAGKVAYLNSLARDGAQLLLNQIFALPTETSAEGVFAKLPNATTTLPRAKPVPKAKSMTRWEKFAKAKGIQKTKKSRMQFDEASGEFKPQWGYKGTNNDTNDWLIEVPENGDPDEDQYEKRREEKKERVDKNKKQQRRNLEEAAATAAGKNPREVRKAELQKKILESKASTASLGRFDAQLKNEDKIKVKRGKRKFEADTVDAGVDKESALNVAQKVLSGGDSKVLNTAKAVRHLHKTGGTRQVASEERKKFRKSK
ncbi:Rhodanese- sulfurtransferase [Gaertneriomyces sp. JEL0708]|nr:RRS1-domain-containing protein [Gaertneriomyces semiglobifer]KAJ3190251.1 Rhodanese- sulfurtransferase [Gaertneriomyces sp. JEL0708]